MQSLSHSLVLTNGVPPWTKKDSHIIIFLWFDTKDLEARENTIGYTFLLLPIISDVQIEEGVRERVGEM